MLFHYYYVVDTFVVKAEMKMLLMVGWPIKLSLKRLISDFGLVAVGLVVCNLWLTNLVAINFEVFRKILDRALLNGVVTQREIDSF